MTDEEKRALPTILDVLEELAEKEYFWHKDWTRQPNFLAPYFAEDGEYMITAIKSHSMQYKLLPGSQSTFTYIVDRTDIFLIAFLRYIGNRRSIRWKSGR